MLTAAKCDDLYSMLNVVMLYGTLPLLSVRKFIRSISYVASFIASLDG